MSPIVLALHGFLGRDDDWAEIAELLQPELQIIAPDLPGHGKAVNLPPSAYSMDAAADDLIRTLDERGISKASVAGYSMGGRLALHITIRHPNRVERLLTISASPGLKSEEERAARRELDLQRGTEIAEDLHGFLRRWYQAPLFNSMGEEVREALMAKRSENVGTELQKSLDGMGTGAQPSHWGHLHRIRIPAWAMAGAGDKKFVEIAKQMAERSSITSIVVPDAGHALLNERPKEVASLMRTLLPK